MSNKDYAGWHIEKLRPNNLAEVPYCNEQEIRWMSVGCNVGYEEDGKGASFARPVLILKKFNYRFILSQIRAFDTRRLLLRFG